jgi:predicted RND superfamily exporter protein
LQTYIAYTKAGIQNAAVITALKAQMDKDLSKVMVKFATISSNTTLKDSRLPASQLEPVYDRWNAFVTSVNAEAPAGLNTALQAARGKWVYAYTQRLYVSSALSGGGSSLALAYAVLLISTGNWIISTFALITLISVVASLLGAMVLNGWQLGSTESICATILVGLSVDYVVHLANAYVECTMKTRDERVTVMLKEMGHTVIGGALTSVGASLILFGCQLQFFFKFGWFMCTTCFLSIVFSLGLFTAMCVIGGPAGNAGEIPLPWLTGKNKNQVSPMEN